MPETSILLASTGKISREELAMVPTPPATATHRPVPHHVIVEALVETLGFRQIGVIREEYAVSKDGMRCSAFWTSPRASRAAASRSA